MTTSSSDAHAQAALEQLAQRGLPPTPENYAVWFHYCAGENRDLCEEIRKLISAKVKFTSQNCAYLYNTYVNINRTQQAIDHAAVNAQKLLSDVLKAVDTFSGETKSYHKGVDQYLDDISHDLGGDESVKNIVKQLIEKTATLKESGEKINEKLEASTREIVELKKNLEQVTVESQRDALTGLYNRKTFEHYFEGLSQAAGENNTPLCLLILDIDHFKHFNDKFGHLLGDEVLKIVSRSLMDILKGRDIVARFGGEEFVVLLPETPIEGAMKVAEMIRANIAGKQLKRKDTGENYGAITVSIGAGHFRARSDTLTTLIQRADKALYQAKHAGRNRVVREAA